MVSSVAPSGISTVLSRLRDAPHTVPSVVSGNKPTTTSGGAFLKLLGNARKGETSHEAGAEASESNSIDQIEIDARQKWLTELNKLKDDYKVKLSKDVWTMQDSSKAMQYECRKAYQRLINGKRKRTAIGRMKTFGQMVKYANVLFRLNIPTLMQFDTKMDEITSDPVTLYKLDEMYNESSTLAPEDPRVYIAKQVMWPIITGLALKAVIHVFKPYVDVEDLFKFSSAAMGNKTQPQQTSTNSGNMYAGMVEKLLGSFITRTPKSQPEAQPRNSRAEKPTTTHQARQPRAAFDLAALLSGKK